MTYSSSTEKMVRAAHILFLPLLMAFSGGSSSVSKQVNLVTHGMENITQSHPIISLDLGASTVTCEPTYGFLPCTTVVWGQLFLIVVYELLLSIGGQYLSDGSNLFFQMFGTGIFGASLFHILGTIPEVAVILVTGLSGSKETAESMATMSMSMLAGSTVLLITLVWGSCVFAGNYNISDSSTSSAQKKNKTLRRLTDYGVSTDDATSYTARIMILSLFPFLILQIARLLNSSSGIRLVILISLLVSLVFLLLYCFYQVFQPWIQERRLAYVTKNFVKNNLVPTLLTVTGEPDESRIRALFHEIDQNRNSAISAAELRALLLGIKLERVDLSNEEYVENLMRDFDFSRNGQIDETEFHRGISKWLYEANQPHHDQFEEQPKFFSRRTAQCEERQSSEERQSLVAKKPKQQSQTTENSWFNYSKAGFLIIIGIALMALLAMPLIQTIEEFSNAVNIPSFIITYIIIPVAMNYSEAVDAIKSAREKTKEAMSLTFSEIYNGVFMNNTLGLVIFLLLVYIRDLSWNVSAEVLVVLIVCVLMGLFTSLITKFPLWTGIIACLLYPISIGFLYLLTEVLGWS